MFCSKSISYLLLLVSLLFISLSHGTRIQISGLIVEGEYGVVSWGTRRSVLEEDNNGGNSSLVLAAKRTHRKDPLNGLEYYKGGWNISDERYISSVAFTASPLFLIATIWFFGFGLCLVVICFCFCCCRRRPYGYSQTAYTLSLILLSLFNTAAIIGCVVLYTGQGKFHGTTQHTLGFIVKQADSTVENLTKVSDFFYAAKRAGVDQVFLPLDVQNNIDKVEAKIKASANILQTETTKNKNHIRDVLDFVSRTLIVIAAAMLVLALLGFLFSILGMQVLVYILVILGWMLVAVTFLLCGVFLVLHNVVGDTCIAMGEWVQNPTVHTSLDDVLPCLDKETSRETLSESKEVNYQLVGVVNGIINNVSNQNLPPGAGGSLYYNQSGPLVPVLCRPFNSDKTDRKCAAGEVELSDATTVWRNYICQVSEIDICITEGRLTPVMYDQMTAAVNASYGLYQYQPFLNRLLNCSFVRETFMEIEVKHCPDLELYSRWIYIGLTMVSAAVMISLVFWVVYAREKRHRKYTRLVDARSTQQDSKNEF